MNVTATIRVVNELASRLATRCVSSTVVEQSLAALEHVRRDPGFALLRRDEKIRVLDAVRSAERMLKGMVL